MTVRTEALRVRFEVKRNLGRLGHLGWIGAYGRTLREVNEGDLDG